MADLLIAMGEPAPYLTAGDCFAAMASASPAFAGLHFDALALRGTVAPGAMAGAGR